MFIDKLIEKIIEKNNPTIAGLDPRIEFIPESIKKKHFNKHGDSLKACANAIWEFNVKILDAISDIVPAVKLQLGYFEMYGLDGIKVFRDTIELIKKKGLLVIVDGKRNDILTTAQAYSSAYLGRVTTGGNVERPVFDVDALTVNPYLGVDGVKPFINDCKKYGKGIFILVKTSNKSSGQLQDLITHEGKSIYEVVAEHVDKWTRGLVGKYGYSSVGAVVGATYPNQAKVLRKILKRSYILVPGYGAQGGTAKDVVYSFGADGLGAVVNASRSIMCAYKSDIWKDVYSEDKFDEACKAEAIRMRDDIIDAICKNNKTIGGNILNESCSDT